jgi:hypothetical protein
VITAAEATQLQQGAKVQIAGYGLQQSLSGLQQVFGFIPKGVVGHRRCAESFINELGPAEMQIGDDNPSTPRKCKGDSGGPTYLQVQTPHGPAPRVVGVTSHAYMNPLDLGDLAEAFLGGTCNRGGVDTRVDPHLTWLDATLRAACTAGIRAWCEVPGILPPQARTDN